MNAKDVPPKYFHTQAALRRWLEKNHDRSAGVMAGVYKLHAADRGITYTQLMEELLCFGWIDSVTYGVDADSFKIRITPRKPNSLWSPVNVAKVKALIAEGKMAAPGLAAYEARDEKRSAEHYAEPRLSAAFERRFRANRAAWRYFEAQRPSYRKIATRYVMQARREETRTHRLEALIESCAAGEWLPQLGLGAEPARRKVTRRAPASRERA